MAALKDDLKLAKQRVDTFDDAATAAETKGDPIAVAIARRLWNAWRALHRELALEQDRIDRAKKTR